jgi:hypothetical protein
MSVINRHRIGALVTFDEFDKGLVFIKEKEFPA